MTTASEAILLNAFIRARTRISGYIPYDEQDGAFPAEARHQAEKSGKVICFIRIKEVMIMKFYRCAHCGQIIEIVKGTGVPVMCCGEAMQEIIPGTTDASVEKHVPV